MTAFPTATLPRARDWAFGGRPYKSSHCLAVYHRPAGEGGLALPGILLAEALSRRNRRRCSLARGFPAAIPAGSLLLATLRQAEDAGLSCLETLRLPAGEDAYGIVFGAHCALVGRTERGVGRGAQTLLQILAGAPSDLLPGGVLTDAPAYAQRSVVLDGRSFATGMDFLMEVMGSLNSFKGSRLHLLLDPGRPVRNAPGAGAVTLDAASELRALSRNYGVTVVPWVDALARVEAGGAPPGESAREALRLARLFGGHGLGIGGCGSVESDRYAENFLRAVFTLADGSMDVYLDGETLREMAAGERDGTPPNAVGVLRVGARMPAPPPPGSGGRFAVFQESGCRGLLRPEAASVARRRQAALDLARTAGAAELGYWAAPLEDGHVWQADLPAAVACIVAGWEGEAGARTLAARVDELLFGAAGAEAGVAADASARMLRRRVEAWGAAFLDGALGRTVESGAVAAGAGTRQEEEEAQQKRLSALRPRVRRNGHLLEYLEWELLAMRFFAARARHGAGAEADRVPRDMARLLARRLASLREGVEEASAEAEALERFAGTAADAEGGIDG